MLAEDFNLPKQTHDIFGIMARGNFISSNGSSGEPKLANAEKGKHLLEKAIAAAITFTIKFKKWPLMKDLRKFKK